MSGRAACYWIILLGVGVVIGLAFIPRAPQHKGKPVSYWVDQACRYGNAREMEEVKQIGPAAVPYLVDRLGVSKARRGMWLEMRARLPEWFKRRYPDVRPADEIRYGAIVTLGRLGAGAKPAVPDLIRLIPESEYVINSLAAIGPDALMALPALKGELTNQNPFVRGCIASAMWHIGRETNFVLQVCTNLMMPGTPDGVTMNAAGLLSRLNSEDVVPAVPFVLRVLQVTNWSASARANAASVLGKARMDTSEIRAALLQGINTEQAEILQRNCALALWRLDSKYASIGTRLALQSIITLTKQFPQNRQEFAKWLNSRELDPSESVPTLQALLSSESEEMRKAAAGALKSIQTSGGKEMKP